MQGLGGVPLNQEGIICGPGPPRQRVLGDHRVATEQDPTSRQEQCGVTRVRPGAWIPGPSRQVQDLPVPVGGDLYYRDDLRSAAPARDTALR